MKKLLTLSDKDIFPNTKASVITTYEERLAVKMVLFDEDNKLAMVGTKRRLLPGGGLELDEHIYDAAVREVREEVGCAIDIIREIATTEEFREKIGRHQITHFLLASVEGEKGLPQTTQADEQGIVIEWHTLDDAVKLLEKQKNEIPYEDYNACFNVRTHLHVLRELQKGDSR